MRAFLAVIFSVGLTSIGFAAPLSVKDVALMLRSGYSSDAVLQEIASRRVLDRLDSATKTSMLEFRASPQLIDALENGTYLVSATEADKAKTQAAEIAARRAAQVEEDRKFNTLYQTQLAQKRAQTAALPPPNERPLLAGIKETLVRCRNGSVTRADGTELEKKKLIGLYYSAHWCAPCRKFTPQLVDYYNRVAAQHPEFEIIFVSADRSRFQWETYIQETNMPWLAIDYDQLASATGLRQLGGNSIPSLLVLDDTSHLVASCYDGDRYVGPQHVLETLDKIFAQTK